MTPRSYLCPQTDIRPRVHKQADTLGAAGLRRAKQRGVCVLSGRTGEEGGKQHARGENKTKAAATTALSCCGLRRSEEESAAGPIGESERAWPP